MGTTGIYTFAAPYLTWFLHTTEKAPHPVWSGKLSSVGPHQYCDRWLRGNPRWGTVFLLFSAPVQNRLFFPQLFLAPFPHLWFAFLRTCVLLFRTCVLFFQHFVHFFFFFFPQSSRRVLRPSGRRTKKWRCSVQKRCVSEKDALRKRNRICLGWEKVLKKQLFVWKIFQR